MSKHSNTAETIINIVASSPNATASTLYDYFRYCGLGEPDEEEINLFDKKVKKVLENKK